MTVPQTPLFIPLAAKWFVQFESGAKDTEYRVYGPRWNEKTCRAGRPVTLSYGYGQTRRLYGRIVDFNVVGPDADPAIGEVFPGKDRIAAIKVELYMGGLIISDITLPHGHA